MTTQQLLLGTPRFDPSVDIAAGWRAAFATREPASAVAAVRGDFAVGLRDAEGRTFLAVDRFAVKTLCYSVVDGTLRFAERADELADAGTQIDPQAIYDYLHFHTIPSPRTIYQGVYRLPAGHWARFARGRLHVAPYWSPEFRSDAVDLEGAKGEFLTLLEQSVARTLDGGKPGCFLSGGTDSSTVAGMIGRVTGRPAATYSIGFEANGYDEMAFARVAATHFGTEHHEYYVTPDDVVRGVSRVAGHFDQPFGNSSALPAFYCADFARQDGVTRLLAGDGGDELFGGNTRYAKQRVFGAYALLPSFVRQRLLEPMLLSSAAGRLPVLRKAASYVDQACVPMPDRLLKYNLLHRLGVDDVLTPGMLARVDSHAPLEQQRQVWQMAQASSPIDRSLAYDWRYTLAESDLPKVRGACGLAGVDVAFPLLDDELLALSMKLPAHYKVRGLKLRWFFKRALTGFLPDEILRKRKQGFGLPFGVWATQHDSLRELATDSLRQLGTRGVVRPEFIDQLLRDRLPAHPGYYGEMVWILMMLEQWLRQHRPDWRLDSDD